MRKVRTILTISLVTLGLAGCGSSQEDLVLAPAAPQAQPVVLKKSESGEWRLPEPRDGMFLVVLCRASNIDHLASSRQQSFRKEDLIEALRHQLELKLTGQLAVHRDEFPRASAFDIVNFLDAEIREAAATAEFGESELVHVNSAAYAAYQLAEIKHADIDAALDERARIFAESQGWDADHFVGLVNDAVSALTTAAGGNDNYIAVD